jgi:hypothetical protein
MPRATRIESVSIAGVTAHMSPVGLYMYASEFLHAAKAAPPSEIPLLPARTYLICHALELALKAFLSLKGRSLDQLASGAFGHNLDALLAEAQKLGISVVVRLNVRQLAEIRRASDYYSEKVFEYPAVAEAIAGYPKNPNVRLLLSAAEALMEALRGPCLASG